MSAGPTDSADAIAARIARLQAQQSRLAAQLGAGERHFRHLARSVWRVQEDERRRIARELHDGVGQNLTALGHRLASLAKLFPDGPPAELAQAMALCDSALADTRSLSRLLRPQILDDLGLEAALRWLLRSSAEAGGLETVLEVDALPPRIDGEIATVLFRVAQEALANALRHAGARHVVARLMRRGDELVLLIADDGVGCDATAALGSAAQGRSTGLSSMRERLVLFGGRFQFDSSPGGGTQVRAWVPLEAAEPGAPA